MRLNPDRHELEHDGVICKNLWPKHVDLLRVLARKYPATVSYEELFEVLWPRYDLPFDPGNNIRVHAALLRGRLKQAGLPIVFQTVRKLGMRAQQPIELPPEAETAVAVPASVLEQVRSLLGTHPDPAAQEVLRHLKTEENYPCAST